MMVYGIGFTTVLVIIKPSAISQEARARHLLLDRQEAELEKVIKLTGSLQSMSKVRCVFFATL
jgi:ribosomal protein S13